MTGPLPDGVLRAQFGENPQLRCSGAYAYRPDCHKTLPYSPCHFASLPDDARLTASVDKSYTVRLPRLILVHPSHCHCSFVIGRPTSAVAQLESKAACAEIWTRALR